MWCRVLSLLLLLLAASVANAELLLKLDGLSWAMSNENKTLSLITNVPAYPLEVLRSQGVIEDPLYRYGELESRWVGMESWEFSTVIPASEVAPLLSQAQVLLQLDGVDTFADVFINEQKVTATNNMHRQWTLPVKSYLKANADNSLRIVIKSAFKESIANKAAYPYHIPTLYNTGSIGAYNFARKSAFDFGWDWGPALAASGIHGSVKLIAFSQPTLAGAYVAQSPTSDGFKLSITSQFWVPAVDTKGFLTVSLPELDLTQQQELAFAGSALNANELNPVEVKSELAIDAASVQLWWPAGGNYGPHKLYDVDISYTPEGTQCAAPPAQQGQEQETEQPQPAFKQQPEPAFEQQQQQQKQQQAAGGGFNSNQVVHLAGFNPAALQEYESGADYGAQAYATGDQEQQEEQEHLSALQEKGGKQTQAQKQQQRRHLLAANAAKQTFPAAAATFASYAQPTQLSAQQIPAQRGFVAQPMPSAQQLPPLQVPSGQQLPPMQVLPHTVPAQQMPAVMQLPTSHLPGQAGASSAQQQLPAEDLLAAQQQQQQQQEELSSADTQDSSLLSASAEQQLPEQALSAEELAAAQPPAGQNTAADAWKGLIGAISSRLRQAAAAGAGAGSRAQQCSSIKKRVGFRTVELVMQPLPQAVQELFGSKKGFEFEYPKQKVLGILARDGAGQWANNEDGVWSHFTGDDIEVDGAVAESFYFKVNGVPIFMKGANVIPLNVLPTNSTPELITATLQAAVDSNQNMLRVWGGGLYHTEDFYNFADENGLLIWQDAMFGGSHYPRTQEWLDNYAAEISQQAQRLSWHPSIALWCGNNEIDLSYEWSNSTLLRSNRNMFVVDYQAVFIDTVRKNIKQVNPATIFVDSSPFKGAMVDTPDLYLKRWGWIGDPRYGTIHSYNYMSDCEDFRSYPLGKFVSEFGWQSYPLPETYAAAMDPERDWGVGNPMNEFRNRRSDVTPQFLLQYAKHFRLPKDWNPADIPERMRRFRSYLWIGNMQHMRCYETALNFWRRLRSNSKSLTMGVMYWQLNDIWQGASWSSIDYSGRWKPVHYAVKRAYAPLAVQAVLDKGEVQIFVVSDMTDTTKATVTMRLVSLSDSPDTCRTARRRGADSSVVESFAYDVPGLFATRVWKKAATDVLKSRAGCTATTCYLSVTAAAPGAEPSESQLWFTQFKNMELPDPAIIIDNVKLISPVEVNITVRSARPAPLVMLSASADRVGHFTDNGFNLDPCEPRTVTYIAHDNIIEAADLQQPGGLFSADSLFDHSSWKDVAAAAPAQHAKSGVSAAGSIGLPKNGKVQ